MTLIFASLFFLIFSSAAYLLLIHKHKLCETQHFAQQLNDKKTTAFANCFQQFASLLRSVRCSRYCCCCFFPLTFRSVSFVFTRSHSIAVSCMYVFVVVLSVVKINCLTVYSSSRFFNFFFSIFPSPENFHKCNARSLFLSFALSLSLLSTSR